MGQKGREREQAAAAVDETGNRGSQGCQMFSLELFPSCDVTKSKSSQPGIPGPLSNEVDGAEGEEEEEEYGIKGLSSGKILPLW